MAESDGQERTEEPTAKRRRESQEKGQIARSRELTTTLVLLAGGGGMFMMGGHLVGGISNIMRNGFEIQREEIYSKAALIDQLKNAVFDALSTLAPLFILIVLIAMVAPTLLGGFSFSPKALAFKWEKLDPIKGLKKVFGARGLMELVKALAKFLLIGSIISLLLWLSLDEFIGLGAEPIRQALAHAIKLIAWSFIAISAGLIIIALVDIPFQIWDHTKQLKMTRQEVKDEYKQTEGSPEVKGRIRQLQREFAERRMMAEVPKADVVVTNPTHYAIALRYEQETMAAPIVVAKGADIIAGHIRDIAKAHNVPIVSSPALARSIFHTTKLDNSIPEGLYLAVAQVLAYVFQLKQRPGHRAYSDSLSMPNVPIPDDLIRD